MQQVLKLRIFFFGYANCAFKAGILESRIVCGKVSPELKFTSLFRVLPNGGMGVRVGTEWEGTKMKHQVWTKVVVGDLLRHRTCLAPQKL